MFEVGTVCRKNAGRELGRFCVVVDKKDNTFVVVDGDVRRRRCNVKHLTLIGTVLKISKGANTEAARKAIGEAGFKLTPKTKPKPPKEKPVKKRVLEARAKAPEEPKKKVAKKPAKKKAAPKKAVSKETKKPAKKKAVKKAPAKKAAKKPKK